MGKLTNFLTGVKKAKNNQKCSWLRAFAFTIFIVAVVLIGRLIVVGLPEVKTNVWLDTGSLPDDNIALAMTVANRKSLNLCGVTVQVLDSDYQTSMKNTLSLLTLFGAKKVPVAGGAYDPLIQQKQVKIDTRYALGDLKLKDNGKNYTVDNSILYMRNEILSLPENEKITIVAVTPLTTEAALLKMFPEVIPKIERIIFMGGAINIPGNVTPYAEFNIYQDPKALDTVMQSGIPVVMVPLDLTQQLQLTKEDFEPLLNSDKEELVEIGRLIERIANSRDEYKGRIAPIHDMVCVQYLTQPKNFTGYYARVEVILDGDQRGKVIATKTNKNDKNAIYVLSNCSQENFVKTFNEDLNNLTEYIYYFKAQK